MPQTLPILTFHALDERPSVISCAPRLFQQGMAVLHAHGYRTLDLLEAVALLRQQRPFPERTFVVTFDDGYQSVYTEALPVLQRFGMSATVFVTLGSEGTWHSGGRLPTFEGRTMLSWQEMRHLQQAGCRFGAHTLTHPDLTCISEAQARVEMQDSQAIIEDMLGTSVSCFAYPFGRYDQRRRDLASEYFVCACTDTLGLLTPGSDPYALARVDAYYVHTARLFQLMSTPWFPWYVRMRNVPRRLRRAARSRMG